MGSQSHQNGIEIVLATYNTAFLFSPNRTKMELKLNMGELYNRILVNSQSHQNGIEIRSTERSKSKFVAPNRTKMELKYSYALIEADVVTAPNRTKMELKSNFY